MIHEPSGTEEDKMKVEENSDQEIAMEIEVLEDELEEQHCLTNSYHSDNDDKHVISEAKNTPGQQRPAVWDYFFQVAGEHKVAVCKQCSKCLSYKSSITNLKTHLKHLHIKQYMSCINKSEQWVVPLEPTNNGTNNINVKKIAAALLTRNQEDGDAPHQSLKMPTTALHQDMDTNIVTYDGTPYVLVKEQRVRAVLPPDSQPGDCSQDVERDPGQPFVWSQGPALLYFQLFNDHKEKVGKCSKFKSKDALFQFIVEEMAKKGYKITLIQARTRYRTLETKMKNWVQRTTKKTSSGRRRIDLEYEDQMVEMFGKQHKLVPSCVLGPREGLHKGEMLKDAGLGSGAENVVEDSDSMQSTPSTSISSVSQMPCTPSRSKSKGPSVRDGKTAVILHALKESLDRHNSLKEKDIHKRVAFQNKLIAAIEKKNEMEKLKLRLLKKRLKLQKCTLLALKKSEPETYKDMNLESSSDSDLDNNN